MAKAVVESLESVPEPLRAEYEAKDGKFVLKVDGDLPIVQELKNKVVEFRDNNVKYLKEKDEALTKLKNFDGMDPVEYVALKSKVAEFEKVGVNNPNAVLEIARKQVEAATAPLTAKLAAIEAKERDANAKLAKKELEATLTKAAMASGVDEAAVPDFLVRGLQVFSYQDGQVVAKNGDQPVFSKRNPAAMLDVLEWAEDLSQTAPHLFKGSRGAGTPGGAGAPAPKKWINGLNPLEFGRNLEAIAKGEAGVAR